jgi:1,4-alpha-glucan branching enzyme
LDLALALGINGNPFAALGPHDTRAGRVIRAFLPSATKVELLRRPGGASRARQRPVQKLCRRSAPYLFPICRRSIGPRTHTLSDCCSATSDLFFFNEGRHFELGKCLGAQSLTVDGVSGMRFAVWAPSGV